MQNNNPEVITRKRIVFIAAVIILCFLIIILRISIMQLKDVKASVANLNKLSVKTVYKNAAPRGKIYDRNYNVIVDNVGINKIVYKKKAYTSTSDMIKLAYKLGDKLDVSYTKLTDRMLREFWVANNSLKASKSITEKEQELYERRKLKASEIENLKLKRVSKKELKKYDERDKETAYIYYLMNNGYSYDDKTIKEDVTDEEYAYVSKNKSELPGISTETSWKRTYPYGDTLRQILGNVSTSEQGLPEDLKAAYLNKGYSLNDRVGISYLELEYEDELRGTKDKYEIKNGKEKLISRGKRGNDIVLSIDINLQKELEDIISEELIKSKSEANTEVFDHSATIITEPKTGLILAMASKQITDVNGEYKVSDYTTNILTGSNTPGSIVKGASMLVGYSTGSLKIGDVFYDKCIKFKNTPEKCSWTNGLGALNDINALKFSSNSYQFQLALKVAGINYYYNMPVKLDDTAINKYRTVFNELGLGKKSGIDLPIETEGYKGKKTDAGLLLNYAIGQYDTYTPLQISSYINTIINVGNRLKLNMVKEIRNKTNDEKLGTIKSSYSKQTLNTVNIDKVYFDRVKEGFINVMQGYLGRGYMGDSPNPAGKTGTSETFYDYDKDGVVDTETYSSSFIGYAPYDNPLMSIVTISPHVRLKKSNSTYASLVNKRITARICNKFFEIYK